MGWRCCQRPWRLVKVRLNVYYIPIPLTDERKMNGWEWAVGGGWVGGRDGGVQKGRLVVLVLGDRFLVIFSFGDEKILERTDQMTKSKFVSILNLKPKPTTR